MPATPHLRVAFGGAAAANISWARTPDRSERTEPARRNSPTRIEYWERYVRNEGIVREQDIPAAAANYHSTYMKELSDKAIEARRAKAEGHRKAIFGGNEMCGLVRNLRSGQKARFSPAGPLLLIVKEPTRCPDPGCQDFTVWTENLKTGERIAYHRPGDETVQVLVESRSA